MSSTSFPEDMVAYVASRLVVGRIVLLWLALSVCALIVSREISPAIVVFGAMLAAALIAQFRLWDDLADRDYDAILHPQRVLVATIHTRRFAYLCGLLALPVAVALGIGYGIGHLAVYGGLLAAMSVLYAAGGIALPRLLRAHLVLLKYPVFIWLCAQDADPAQWVRVGVIVYLALSLLELVSDSVLRRSVAWRGVLLFEAVALAALLILL